MDYNAFFNNLVGIDPNAIPNDPFEGVDRMRTRYDQAGVKAPAPKTSMSLPEMAFKVLDYPGNVVRSAVFGTGTKDIGAALLGKTKHTRDYLSGFGMKDSAGKTALGFVGDVLLDPLMLVGSGAFKHAGAKAMETSVARTVAGGLGGAIERTAASTGHSAAKVANTVGHTADTNVIDAAKTSIEGSLTQFNAGGWATRTQNAWHSSKALAKDADAVLYQNLSRATPGVSDIGTKHEILGGLETGKLLGPNAFYAGKPTYTSLFERVERAMSTTLSGTDKNSIVKMHISNPAQLHTLVNIVDNFGTKIKSFGNARTMSAKFQKTNLVDELVADNARLLGAQVAKDDANVRAVFANNLVMDLDRVGEAHFFGVMLPTGKAILPLADVSNAYSAVGKAVDKLYIASPQYKAASDWVRQAVIGKPTRSAFIAGGDTLKHAQAAINSVKAYKRQQLIAPSVLNDYVANTFGKDLLNQGAKIHALSTALRELGPTEARNPHTLLILSNNLSDKGLSLGITADEINAALVTVNKQSDDDFIAYMKAKDASLPVTPEMLINHQKQVLKRMAVKDLNGEISSTELAYAHLINHKAQAATDTMWQIEKLQGLARTDAEYNSEYVKHMYEYGDPDLKRVWDDYVDSRSAEELGLNQTTLDMAGNHPRAYKSIAEAIARDGRISEPMYNMVHLTQARLNDTLRHGMNRGIVEGIDQLIMSRDMAKLYAQMGARAENKFSHTVYEAIPGGGTRAVEKDYSDIGMRQSRMEAVNATIKATQDALGGMAGLKALTEVIRPASMVHPGDIGKEWIAINALHGFTKAGGSDAKYYVSKDLAPYVRSISKPMTDVIALRQFLNITDEATRVLKKVQTTYSPAFAIRNFVGEALMSFVGNGTSIRAFRDAVKLMARQHGTTEMNGASMYVREAINKLDTLRATDKVTIGGVEHSVAEAKMKLLTDNAIDLGGRSEHAQSIYNQTLRHGLLTSGHTSEYAEKDIVANMITKLNGESALEKAGTAFKDGKLGPIKAVGSLAESGADWGDSVFRLADYIHNLRTGMTEANAAAKVKQFHVDYQDLTQAERTVFRRLVPYYTFMRKNIPIQLRLMVERPAYYGTVGKMLDNSYAALGDPATPEYLEKNMSFPIYKNPETGVVTYLSWNLPMTDLAKFETNPKDTLKNFISTLHPGIKAPFELAIGKNVAFGSDVKPMDYALGQLGGVKTAIDVAKQAVTPDEEFTGKYASPMQNGLMKQLMPNINPQKEELGRAYAYREQLLNDMQKRKKAGQPIPELPAKPNFGVNFGLTPYDVNANYAKNKDWVRRNKNTFTP